MTTTPIAGQPDWAASQASPWNTENQAKRMVEAVARAGVVEGRTSTAPPGTCADGACYLVAASPTGAWSGKAGQMAVAVGTNAASGWYFLTVAVEGVQLWVRDEDVRITHNGSAWVEPFAQTEIAAASIATPPSGKQTLFFDTADHKLKRKDSSGTVTIIA